MFCLNIGKKLLLPTTKAWKHFVKITKSVAGTPRRIHSAVSCSPRAASSSHRRRQNSHHRSSPSPPTNHHQHRRRNPSEAILPAEDSGARALEAPPPRESACGVDEAWEAVAVAASPDLKGVDERAEEFILRFREKMRMEKEQCSCSCDSQELLDRSRSA